MKTPTIIINTRPDFFYPTDGTLPSLFVPALCCRNSKFGLGIVDTTKITEGAGVFCNEGYRDCTIRNIEGGRSWFPALNVRVDVVPEGTFPEDSEYSDCIYPDCDGGDIVDIGFGRVCLECGFHQDVGDGQWWKATQAWRVVNVYPESPWWFVFNDKEEDCLPPPPVDTRKLFGKDVWANAVWSGMRSSHNFLIIINNGVLTCPANLKHQD